MTQRAEDPGKAYVFEGADSDVSEEIKAERVRRMKALVRQMSKEELEPQRKFIPQIKGRGLIAAASFIAVILFSVSSLYNYNLFINLGEQVRSSEGHVEAAIQRRSNLFVNLVNLTLNHASLEEEIFRHVADVRTKIDQTNKTLSKIINKPQTGSSGANIESSLSRLLAVVEQYPNIQSSTTYQQLMDELVEIENRISLRRDEYNEAVRSYNRRISSFPWFILARATGFNRYDYYKATGDISKGPLLSPKTFERLLPKPAKYK